MWFTYIIANIKSIALGIFAIIVTFLGINYMRRGNKVEDLKQENKALKEKEKLVVTQKKIDDEASKKIAEVDNEKDDAVLNDLNNLHK